MDDLENNRALGPSPEETSLLRQLKLLVVVLTISNIVLGGFSFYFLRSVDQKYSKLIGLTVPTLNDMQTLTAISGAAMHSTKPPLFADSPEVRTETVQAARNALQLDRDLRKQILQREWLSRSTEERLTFEQAGEAFSRAAAETIELASSGQRSEASRQREEVLRPAFHRYIAATTSAADALEAEGLRKSGTIKSTTGSVSKMMLGMASWPLMILGALLLVTIVFVLVMLLNVLIWKREAI